MSVCIHTFQLTFLVLKPEYARKTRSIPWLPMHWLLAYHAITAMVLTVRVISSQCLSWGPIWSTSVISVLKMIQNANWFLMFSKISSAMAYCKTVVSPLLMHWRYCNLVLSHRVNHHPPYPHRTSSSIWGLLVGRFPSISCTSIWLRSRANMPEFWKTVISDILVTQAPHISVTDGPGQS